MRITHYIIGALAALSFSLAGVASADAQNSNGKVTTAAPSYTNNTWAPLSLTPTGELRVTGGGSGGVMDTNLSEIGGNAVTVTTPGVLDVNVVGGGGSGGTSSNFNTTFPGVGTAIGVANSATGNMMPLILDNATQGLRVNCVAGCVAGSGVAQGQATTAAPTYIDATPNPLSLDLAGNLRVIVGNASLTVSGTVAATQSGAWNVGLNAGTNNIGDVDVLTLPSIPAGNNNIGDVDAIQSGTWTVQPGNTANTTPWLMTPVPPTTQADTLSHSAILAATTNSTSVKATPGTLYEISVYNSGSTIAWLKTYNSATAPTCGSGTPIGRYMIPGAASGGAGSNVNISVGKEFTTGIGYCVTTGIADADTGAVAASTYTVNLTYK